MRKKYSPEDLSIISGVYAGPVYNNGGLGIEMGKTGDENEPEAVFEDVYGGPEMMGFRDEPEVEENDVNETDEGIDDEAKTGDPGSSRPAGKPRLKPGREFRPGRPFPNGNSDPRIVGLVYGGPGYFNKKSTASAPPKAAQTDGALEKKPFCRFCGAILLPNAKFCIECGSRVEEKA